MPVSQVEEVIKAAFGAPIAALFDAFDPDPVAAASIGQVHRAAFEGRTVAVKVLYPFVASSFDSNMGLLRRIGGLASMATAVDGRAIVDELGARLQEECDYVREATMQAAFRRAFEDDPDLSADECRLGPGPLYLSLYVRAGGGASRPASGQLSVRSRRSDDRPRLRVRRRAGARDGRAAQADGAGVARRRSPGVSAGHGRPRHGHQSASLRLRSPLSEHGAPSPSAAAAELSASRPRTSARASVTTARAIPTLGR